MTNSGLRIQQAAEATGVNPSTLRLWEHRGLVLPGKTPSEHRRYTQDDIRRIRDIKRLRSVQKLNVAAIKAVLEARGGRGRHGGAAQKTYDGVGLRLQVLRLRQGLTLREVSRRTGLAPSFLSSIENGDGRASVASLKKLARCYGTTLSALAAPRALRTGKVIRAGKYRILPMLGPGIKVEQLAEGQLAMDCQRFTLEPGAGSQGQYSHEGEEFIHVFSGHFEIILEGRERYRLGRGDSMYFKSTARHAWVNPGPDTAVLLWANTPPTF